MKCLYQVRTVSDYGGIIVSSYGGTPRGFNLTSVSTIISLDFGNAPTCGIFVVHFIINIRLFKMIITENLTVREKIDIPKKSYRDWIRQRFCIVTAGTFEP